MTVSVASPAVALSVAAAPSSVNSRGVGAAAVVATSASAQTTYDPTPIDDRDDGMIPARSVRMADTTDDAVTFTSSSGRVNLRLEDGGDDGLKVIATVDGQELPPTYLDRGMHSFVMDGTVVTVDVDHYQTGTGSWAPGIGKDHHRATVTVSEGNDPTRSDDDTAIASAAIDDGTTMTADGVMADRDLAALVQQLTGTTIAVDEPVRLIDHGVLPREATASRQASSVYLGDFGVGYVEFGPEVPRHGDGPAVFLRFSNVDSVDNVQTMRMAGSIPPVGSVSFMQEDGLQTTLSWRYRQDGEQWILDGVDVHRSGTDPATGEPIEQAWSASPSGDSLHATFGELGMTAKDYASLGRALQALPGFERYPDAGVEA